MVAMVAFAGRAASLFVFLKVKGILDHSRIEKAGA